MSVDVSSSPYAPSSDDALGYNRHHAQRIRDMGRSSKETWIKRLWNHMFLNKDKSDDSEDNEESNTESENSANKKATSDNSAGSNMGNSLEGITLPPINRESSLINTQQTNGHKIPHAKENLSIQTSSRLKSDKNEDKQSSVNNSLPGRLRIREKSKTLPIELANSPYIAPKDRGTFKIQKSSSRDGINNSKNSHSSRDGRGKDNSKDPFYPRKTHPYLSQQLDTWRPRLTRPANTINLEKRAKSIVEKAMKEAKIFTCVGPYPVDAYVRFSLRKRGWVEKFGPKANASTVSGTNDKLLCEADEDFEAICDQDIPVPWEEEHGIHAMMSRCARHYPAKFIWGGRAVNNLILKSEVITNHFPKARYFSSKVLLTQSLRDLPWQNDSDPMEFFPRCYILGDDDKEDIIDDFRTTACIGLLKWVLRMYLKGQGRSQERVLQRQNTKYIEVTSSQDCEPENNRYGSIFDDIVTPEPQTPRLQSHEDVKDSDELPDSDAGDCDEQSDDTVFAANSGDNGEIESDGDHDDANPTEDYEPCADVIMTQAADSANKTRPQSADAAKLREGKLLPELVDREKRKKQGGEVPLKAVEWALEHLSMYIKAKNHEDIDIKKRGLSDPQWEQLLNWFYQISQCGAKVPITEGKLREAEDMLKKMKQIWPQYELDGKRNIWIVKPGDMSKGIGIEFLDNLEDILKYATNSTTQGTYVLQKYIERPMLIYQCKFDIRQWFLVTDWNPLTVWFYKESYLRICSQEYQCDSMHESVHLSNVAVQRNYLNGKRSDKLPENNFLTSTQFREYLSDIGAGDAWSTITYPGMKSCIINTMIATQEVTENRKNAFELYGADFMFTEDYRPWLIEINACPGMAPTSVDKCKLCARVIEDTIKVVIDRRENKNCDTGGFELVLRETPMPPTKCVETKFLLEGQRIRRNDLQKYYQIDQKNMKKETDRQAKEESKSNTLKHNEIDETDEYDRRSEESLPGGEDTDIPDIPDSPIKPKHEQTAADDKKDTNLTATKKEEKDPKNEEKDSKKDTKPGADALKNSPYVKASKKDRDSKSNNDKKKTKK